jgi:N-acetylglucosaminyl-diphospho-decaprenol L-rhamnosyltransferase
LVLHSCRGDPLGRPDSGYCRNRRATQRVAPTPRWQGGLHTGRVALNLELSVIVVNWNTREYLRGCLNSVQNALAGIDGEITVVDNGSTDGSAAMVRSEFPAVTLIENWENVGFARANNQGIAISRGPCILLLNSDTDVPGTALSGLMAFMDKHTDAGAVGPKLVMPAGAPQPYGFGGDPTVFYLLKRGLSRLVFHRCLHDWSTALTRQVDWVSGACLMLRREVLDQSGPLDEKIFMYFEDVDLCLRIRQSRWKVYHYPHVEVVHYGGRSLRQNPAARPEYYRSLSYFYRKHYGLISRFILKSALLARSHALPPTKPGNTVII